MNRKVLLTALGTIALLGAAVPSMAQEAKPMGLSFRIGAVFPTDGDTRDEANTLFAVGAEFKIKDMNLAATDPNMRTMLTISADYMGSNDITSVPVLLNIVGRNREWFYSAGAGIGFLDDGVDNTTDFAYQLGIGYDFQSSTTPLFIEGKYWGSGESAFNGFGLYVGVRL